MTNIIMLCRDRLRLTEQALATLVANTSREEYTLTLVDDGSQDFRAQRLLRVWAETHANCALVRIEKSAHVLARAKNLGAFWSEQTFGRGEWLYLSDSDVAFTRDWLKLLSITAENSEKDGFMLWGGQVHPFHQAIPEDDSRCGMTEHVMLDGPSWLMRWSTWDKVGPLRGNAPGTCQGEDVDWCQRLTQIGGRIGVVRPHVVAHTGLTNTAGADAPGRKEREAGRIAGILYE